jgi:NTE family protein
MTTTTTTTTTSSDEDDHERRGLAVVIGGGGSAGAASSCGALLALAEVAELDVRDARVVIGTSAGAAMGADLRLGRPLQQIVEDLHSEDAASMGSSMRAAWKSRPELLRRVAGATWIMAQSSVPGAWRVAKPWPVVQRAFPGALISIPQEHWDARYSSGWPARDLWLVASDLDTGQRVVLTGDQHRGEHVPLTRAVQASCAVPGVFPPVRLGRRRLVDGGVHSPTNLDVAVHTDCRAVVVLAPMAFDRRDPPGYLRSIGRLQPNVRLSREASRVRRAGMTLLTIRPGADEVRQHRFNILSRDGSRQVMEAAYESTVRRLRDDGTRRVLDEIRTAASNSA